MAPEQGLTAIDQPSEIKRRCEEEAQKMVQKVSQVRLNELLI